jgi:LPS export ABC transporter protein LptC
VKSVVVLLGMTMLFSCKNDMKEVSAFAGVDSIPDLTALDFEFLRSDSGRIVAKLQSPVMKQFIGEDAYTVFPDGFKIQFYDRFMNVESVMTGEYGINYEKRKLFVAKRNVIVINYRKQEQLNSDELNWDQRKKRIYSESDIKITTPTEILYGSGMESDEQFKLYEVFNSRGEVEVEEEKTKEKLP